MAKLSVVDTNSRAPSDRSALVSALQAAADAKAALAKHQTAIQRVRSQVWAFDGKIKAAEVKIEEERAAHAHALANAAADDAPAPPSGIKAARQALNDLADERDTVKLALDDLKSQLPDIELAAKQADASIDNEINKLLQPITADLIEREQRLAAELMATRSTLTALLDSAEIRPPENDYRIKHTTLASLVRGELQQQHEPITFIGADTWRAVRQELRTNPNAPLPEIEGGKL